jgi:NADH:ubiquinone oxidoreductase subunit 4 (subunit M)
LRGTLAIAARIADHCLAGLPAQEGEARMAQSYVLWALLGMAGYSFMTLFVKLAERSSEVSTYMVMAVSATIVSIVAIAIVALRGEL